MLTPAVFIKVVPFLTWAQLHPQDVESLDSGAYIERVFISPDVHSLLMLWEEGPGMWAHTRADYAAFDSVRELLNAEVGDDSEETFYDVKDVFAELMSDYGITTAADVPVLRVADFLSAEMAHSKRGKR